MHETLLSKHNEEEAKKEYDNVTVSSVEEES